MVVWGVLSSVIGVTGLLTSSLPLVVVGQLYLTNYRLNAMCTLVFVSAPTKICMFNYPRTRQLKIWDKIVARFWNVAGHLRWTHCGH